jgi:hypothetical protein
MNEYLLQISADMIFFKTDTILYVNAVVHWAYYDMKYYLQL